MAYGYANVSAAELADLALDKPLFGANVIPRAPTLERWNTAGTTAGADATASGFPICRLRDADPGLVSKPNALQNTWYVVYNFGTTVDVDFCAIGPGHNLGSVAISGLSLDFDQNQNGNFAAVDSCDLLAAFPPADDGRIMQLDLDPAAVGTPQRFSDVQYCRLKITRAAGTIIPQITELIIGARYQMPRWPEVGFNIHNLNNLGNIGEPTKGGSIDRNLTAENQFVLDATWPMDTDEVDDYRTWWKKSRGSFVMVWEPSSAPASFRHMVWDNDRLGVPFVDWQDHRLSTEATEQGPESMYLENE